MKKTLDAFMRALDESFKIGVSQNGVSSFVDHLLNGVIDLLDKVSDDISFDKKKSLNASLNNIKRMIVNHSWNPDDLTVDIGAIEQKISKGETTIAKLKRDRYYMDLHKLDDQHKRQRIESEIQQQQNLIIDQRNDLVKIKVSLKLSSKHFSPLSYSCFYDVVIRT